MDTSFQDRVVALYNSSGLSCSQLGAQLGISRNAVIGHLHRWRNRTGLAIRGTPARPGGNVAPRKRETAAPLPRKPIAKSRARSVQELSAPILPPTDAEIFASYANQIGMASRSADAVRYVAEAMATRKRATTTNRTPTLPA